MIFSLIFILAGCRDTEFNFDPQVITSDLITLADRYKKAQEPKFNLDQLPLLKGISPQALYFLSLEWSMADENNVFNFVPYTPERITQLKTLRKFRTGMIGGGTIAFSQETPPLLPIGATGSGLRRFLNQFMQNLKIEKKIYAVELMDKNDRVKHFCHEECQCIADEFRSKLEDLGKRVSAVQVRINATNGHLVSARVGKSNRIISSWSYHVATFVNLGRDDSWFVFDPILFEDLEAHSAAEWVDRVQYDQKYVFLLRTLAI
jgi:hypothetical protein